MFAPHLCTMGLSWTLYLERRTLPAYAMHPDGYFSRSVISLETWSKGKAEMVLTQSNNHTT